MTAFGKLRFSCNQNLVCSSGPHCPASATVDRLAGACNSRRFSHVWIWLMSATVDSLWETTFLLQPAPWPQQWTTTLPCVGNSRPLAGACNSRRFLMRGAGRCQQQLTAFQKRRFFCNQRRLCNHGPAALGISACIRSSGGRWQQLMATGALRFPFNHHLVHNS